MTTQKGLEGNLLSLAEDSLSAVEDLVSEGLRNLEDDVGRECGNWGANSGHKKQYLHHRLRIQSQQRMLTRRR